MAKKAKKKSKTELKIHYKIVYAQRKAAKIRAELEGLNEIESKYKTPKTRLKLEVTREIDGYIKKGSKRKYNTIYNGLLNEGTKVETEIFKLKTKLSKFKAVRFPERNDKFKRGENFRIDIGRAWDSKDIDNAIYKSERVNSVNGLSVKKDKDLIDSIVMKFKLKMTSDDLLIMYLDSDGNARLTITTREENEQFDEGFDESEY